MVRGAPWGLLTLMLTLMVVAFTEVRADGEEPWEPFVQALTERGYFDEAVDYLETFRGQENCPERLRTDLDFRIATLKLEVVATLPQASRAGRLQECREQIERWLAEHPGVEQQWEGQGALGRIYRELGKGVMAAESGSDPEKGQTAREFYEQSGQAYDAAIAACGTTLEAAQKGPNQEGVDLVRGRYLQMKLDRAALALDRGETWPEGAAERVAAWEEGRSAFESIHDTYRNYTGGFSARYYQAKLEWLLGHREEADGMVKEIGLLPNDPAFFTLKTQTLLLAGEMAESVEQPGDCLYFLEKFYDWKHLSPLPAIYYHYAEGLKIQLLAGRDLLRLAELQAENRPQYNKLLKAYFGEKEGAFAKILTANTRLAQFTVTTLDFVAKQESIYRDEAEELLKNPLLAGQARKTSEVDLTDEDGLWRAVEKSWNLWLREQAGEAVAESSGSTSDEVKSLIQDALARGESLLTREKRNELLFRWATIAWVEGDWERAAVLGDYLARQTDSNRSARAAFYALGALRRLSTQGRDAGQSEQEQAWQKKEIENLAALIDRRFGSDRNPEAEKAIEESIFVQIETALDVMDLTAANGLLTRIPETSSSRASFELRYGQALYAAWGRAMTAASQAEERSDVRGADLLNAARDQFQKGLTRKLSSGDSRSDDQITVWSALSLAQISLTQNEPEEAWKWLSHPVIGAVNIVKSVVSETGELALPEHGFPDRNFVQKALLLALRVKVNLGDFEESQKIMGQLEAMNAGQDEQLVAIYVQLGRELEEEVKRLGEAASAGDAKKQEQLDAVTRGFEQFLERISERSAGTSYSTSRWVADTFLSLARGIAGTLTEVPQEAVNYYTRAGRTYQSILKQLQAQPEWCSDANADIFCAVRLSECLRGTGRFVSAMKVLLPVLAEHENNLELQLEAVRVYQSQGKSNKEAYVRAIVGGEPQRNGRNLVWGWNRIITRLNGSIDQNPRFREIYYDAWLNKLTCRYLYLRRLSDPNEAREQAKSAESEILRLRQSHPDLGGAATRKKFDDHLKRFRKQQEEATP